jgi:hypothetical protein
MALAGPPRSYENELPPRLFSHQQTNPLAFAAIAPGKRE